MLQIQGLSKSFGPATLFENVTLQLNVGCRYGLVGANGAGKTTFLKILTGDESASDGTISLPKAARVGVLRQDRFLDEATPLVTLAMMGDREVFEALTRIAEMADGQAASAEQLVALEEFVAARDGYTLRSRASAVLVGLGIPANSIEAPLGSLSGGFKLRVLLAQVLVGNPEVLLLDEPTNHLDILSIAWLEQFLKGYAGCAVIISHDHLFLNSVATHMLDVDYRTITAYVGNYDKFLAQKEQTRVQREAGVARAEKILAEKRAFVERFGAKATKARQAQSRLKQIEKIEIEEVPTTTRRAPHLKFVPLRPSGRDVLSVEGISKAYGEHQVLSDVRFQVRRGERVGIIGANGLGKSTLLKILVEHLRPDSGVAKFGHEVRIGYFAQDHKELLNSEKITPLSFVWDACPDQGTSYVRGQLGRALFSHDEVEKPVTMLSGGEAARLIFCRIMVQNPNVLILDEPTNHLDIEAIEALVDALSSFEGTVLFVSHDRWFVSRLATRIIELTAGGLKDFAGTYAEYIAGAGEDHLHKDAVVLRAKQEKRAAKSEATEEVSREERKRLQNRKKALPKRRDALLEEIDAAEQRLKAITERYCEAGFFETTSAAQQAELRVEQTRLEGEVTRLTNEWEELETELQTLEQLTSEA
jgi:ATPase subunit of ABC transporter with duplicated ATPase domains